MPGRNQRAGLLDVFAEGLAQRSMKQMGSGVIALGRLAYLGMHNRFELLSNMDRLPCLYFMGAHTLYRHHAAVYLGDHVARAVAEDPDITHLSTGVCIKGAVIEGYLAFLSGCQLVDALPLFHNGQISPVPR